MPVKSLDRRARMTREILKQSLIELMKNNAENLREALK